MKKCIAIILVSILLMLFLVGCFSEYNAGDFIGKTSAEIISQYGSFDCTFMPVSEDGLYRSTQCGYTIEAPARGFLGKSEEMLFFITFDENGVAIECDEGYRPGG